MVEKEKIEKAKELIESAEKPVAFTGAGISVASGIPPFRGPDGLWSKYDPVVFDIDFFMSNPEESWRFIKEIFYRFLTDVKPNPAHYAIAKLNCPVITQNIDNLHQEAGSREVIEFHGTAKTLTCMKCGTKYPFDKSVFENIPPRCKHCGGILKPDFVFFKEPIPQDALTRSFQLAETCDLMIVVGTTGEIMPASQIPYVAKRHGATIIEINPKPSNYTGEITDLFLQDRAEEVLPLIVS